MKSKRQAFQADAATWRTLETCVHALAIQHDHDVDDRANNPTNELFTFRLGARCYRLPGHVVQGVQPLPRCIPLSSAPPFVVGLISLHEHIIAVLDIRPLLGFAHEQAPPAPHTEVIIVQVQETQLGLLADSTGAEECPHPDATAHPAARTTQGHAPAWARGIDHYLNIIDPHHMFADPEVEPQRD